MKWIAASPPQGPGMSSVRYRLRAIAMRRLVAILSGAMACGVFARPLALAQPQSSLSPEQQEITPLEVGKPIQRDLSAGQKQTYQITLTAGQYVRVEIRDMGTDVGVGFKLPDGQTIAVWDPVGDPPKVKTVVHVADTSGIYLVPIYARSRAAPGRYEIRIADLHTATATDIELHDARKVFWQSRQLAAQSKWAEALPLMQRAVEIRDRLLAPDDPQLAETLGFLAANYHNLGDYAAEEPLMLRAYQISEKALGPDNGEVIKFVNDLGGFYREKGDYPKALEYERKALAALERTQRMDSPLAAACLDAMARILYDLDDYAGAAKLSRQSLEIWEKMLGPDHFHLAHSLSFSGQAAYDAGDNAAAQAMFQRALTISEKALGQNHWNVAPYLNDVAMVACTTGDYAKGEALFRRALGIYEPQAAMSPPAARATLFGLARCLEAEGNIPEAIRFQSQASEVEEHYISVNLAAGSQREKQVFLDHLSMDSWRNISLHVQQAPDDPAALRLAVTTLLRRKGRVQDAMSNSLAGLRLHLGAEDQKLLDQLNDLNARLAKLVLNGPQKVTAAEQQQQANALEQQRETLEEEISRRSAGFFESSKPVTLEAIQAAIPANAALIEFAVYRPFDPRAHDNKEAYGEPRYVAYVIRKEAAGEWQDLGEAAVVDRLIARLRPALRNPQQTGVRVWSRALDEMIMQPVRALVGDSSRLLISPDGQLDLIPFEALVDETGQYLTERYSVDYLTTGRDLLRMQVARGSSAAPVVVADPFFGEPRNALLTKAGGQDARSPVVVVGRRGTPALDNLSHVYFAPLTGTAQEANAIQSLFPGAEVLTGARASKAAVQQLAAPSILHIATHGFFLEDEGVSARTSHSGTAGARPARSEVSTENPLLRSGLALAGANLHGKGSADGILTALEASNLNLWGTKLVTLSACDTGVGEVRNGEGVYGLRRSFFLAGTETLVMSLWPVSDRITREMMTDYYAGLKTGLGRGEALRQAELSMMKRKGRQHPFYWASFIQSGEWANLDGQR